MNTGLLYRSLAYTLRTQGCDTAEGLAQLETILPTIKIELVPHKHDFAVAINGAVLSQEVLERPSIAFLASKISCLAFVRTYLLAQQRAVASLGGVVLDGRDIGSVVYPQAALKVYLHAAIEVTTFRRWKQDPSVLYETLFYDIQNRDASDRRRLTAPLCCPSGAKILDTTHLNLHQQVEKIVRWVRKIE